MRKLLIKQLVCSEYSVILKKVLATSISNIDHNVTKISEYIREETLERLGLQAKKIQEPENRDTEMQKETEPPIKEDEVKEQDKSETGETTVTSQNKDQDEGVETVKKEEISAKVTEEPAMTPESSKGRNHSRETIMSRIRRTE